MEVWGKGSEELERARAPFQVKGTVCLVIEMKLPTHHQPLRPHLPRRPVRSPTAALGHLSEPLDPGFEDK